jgi:hypothetical protein
MQNKSLNEQPRERKVLLRELLCAKHWILYLIVLLTILILVIIQSVINGSFSIENFLSGLTDNLIGVLAAFAVFDCADKWLSEESQTKVVSEQILDTLKYNTEVLNYYNVEHKREFVQAFIQSIVHDDDVSDMLNFSLDKYLRSPDELDDCLELSAPDCRIRTKYSYRFVLESTRSQAFSNLSPIPDQEEDPYFYVQEELEYNVKYLSQRGNFTNSDTVTLGFIFSESDLDKYLKGNEEDNEKVKDCIFREMLSITPADRDYFLGLDGKTLKREVNEMLRPHLSVDNFPGTCSDVEADDTGIFIKFQVEHDQNSSEHFIKLVLHMPKLWGTPLEAAIVEPTKSPYISFSYEEDSMSVDWLPFLTRGESSSAKRAAEESNGVISLSLEGEWVFPISGVVFLVNRKHDQPIDSSNEAEDRASSDDNQLAPAAVHQEQSATDADDTN